MTIIPVVDSSVVFNINKKHVMKARVDIRVIYEKLNVFRSTIAVYFL